MKNLRIVPNYDGQVAPTNKEITTALSVLAYQNDLSCDDIKKILKCDSCGNMWTFKNKFCPKCQHPNYSTYLKEHEQEIIKEQSKQDVNNDSLQVQIKAILDKELQLDMPLPERAKMKVVREIMKLIKTNRDEKIRI